MAVEIHDPLHRMPQPAGLMQYLTKHVPHYRGLELKHFQDIEPVGKDEIMRNMPDYISDEYAHVRGRLFDLVCDRGENCTVNNNQLQPVPGIIMEQTTGTSGTPGRFPKTTAERAKLAQGIWKHRRKIDLLASPRTFLPFVHLPITATEERELHENNPVVIRSVYESAMRHGVTWIHSQPRLLCAHIRLFNEAGYPRLPRFLAVCETAGEMLRADERRTIMDYFGCQVINQLGCIETWAFGYDDIGSGEAEVLVDNVYLELLDPETHEPITRSGEVGLVALTSRHLRLLPIVRYLNGDRAEWTKEGGSVRIRLHEDRQCNMLLLGGKRVPGAGVARVWLNIAFIRMGYLQMDFIQFVQTSEFQITVRMSSCPKGKTLFSHLQRVLAEATTSGTAITLSHEEVPSESLNAELRAKRYLFVSRMKTSPADGLDGSAGLPLSQAAGSRGSHEAR